MMPNFMRLRLDIKFLLGTVFILITLGMLFIYSASCIFATEKYGSSFYFVHRQLIGLALGFGAFVVALLVPMRFLRKISPLLFWLALLMTGLTLVPGLGQHINGSSRWLRLGFVSLQPSELLKIALFLYLAYLLDKKRDQPFSFVQSYLPFLLILGMTTGLLLLQPDFGLVMTLLTTFFMVLFIVQMRMKYLIATVLAVIPICMALIYMKPYRVKRLFTFLNPWHDPQGAGFQIIQSLIAIGAGGTWGVGLSQSKQKFFYLPMQHTDFIFSIIAEETGFVGSVLLVTLFLAFFYLGMRIVWQLRNTYAQLVTLSFVILISLQALINIGVATGVLPTKGIGLPFVSYGGSCLISSLVMIGLITNAVFDDAV